ncbi:MAG TPA: pyrrolo-quinoline quinone [Verrucomicrobiae bacterium]|nr:pyrrolo-quinoline quinone [Verrucomicrobiae bacterium]
MERTQGRTRKCCRRVVSAAVIFVVFLSPFGAIAANVLTQHNDNLRTGANLQEFVLTTNNVSTAQFGKVFSRSVDGQMYAQPLYAHAVAISNQFYNVVYVCTESNSVYAFDADNAAASNALWHVNLGPPVPIADLNNCGDLSPIVGITSTPVIDPTTGTIYVDAKTVESGNYFHRLHALDIATGQEKFGGPVVVQASVPGTGDGGTNVSFDAQHEHNRPGLLLLSNVVYLAFGSHCDWAPYHGWLLGYGATNLQQVCAFNTTPNGGEGAIWSSGTGPAADSAGNIYVVTGNGSFDANTGGPDLGDTFMKLTVSNNTLAVATWFTPYNQAALDASDLDLGSGGTLLLPTTNMVVGIGKQGVLYLLNRDDMGGYSTANSDTNVLQEFQAVPSTCCIGPSPVYWNGPSNQFLFTWTGGDVMKAFNFTGSSIDTNPLAQGNATFTQSRPGGMSLSANLNVPGSGIVWGICNFQGGTIVAYDAGNVGHTLWTSQSKASRDSLGSYVKFASPTISNGKVYAPTGANQFVVYGLLTAPYQLWRQANFTSAELTNTSISGDVADPDGDGIPNLMEYALSLNPKVPDLNGLPNASVQNLAGTNHLTIAYKQVLYNTDISYTVQVSSDLVTWNSGPGFTAPIGPPVDNGNGTETWTVQDMAPSDSMPARFIRLKITH